MPGDFVGVPAHTPRTSRWRAGPTSFGPLGRILCTLALAALFPWWGLGGFDPLFLWALMGWLLAWAVVAIVAGVGIFLASWNDL